MKRPGTVSPRHHRDQFDDGAGSFLGTALLLLAYGSVAAVVAHAIVSLLGITFE